MITDDLKAASRNRENIARMRELERLGLDKKTHHKLAEVRPIHGRHQRKKGDSWLPP